MNKYLFVFCWLAINIVLMFSGVYLADNISDTFGVILFLLGLLSLIFWFVFLVWLFNPFRSEH